MTLTLTSEDVMPGGDGPNTIGRATQVQISNSADFAGAQWQPFAQQVPWTLAPGGGSKTVYVKYRDAAGRTATASDSIVYVVPTTATPRPTASMTRTPRPTTTGTATVTPTDTPTEMPEYTTTLEPTQTDAATPTPEPPTPTISPTPAVFEATAEQEVDPIALGGFGFAIMVITLALVKYLAARTKI